MVASAWRENRLYDPADVESVHRDMRENLTGTMRSLERQGLARKAHEGCEECSRIRSGAAPEPRKSRQRARLVITPSQLHQLLGLPEGHEIVFVWSTPNPNAVMVLVEGSDLPEVPETEPAPLARTQ